MLRYEKTMNSFIILPPLKKKTKKPPTNTNELEGKSFAFLNASPNKSFNVMHSPVFLNANHPHADIHARVYPCR